MNFANLLKIEFWRFGVLAFLSIGLALLFICCYPINPDGVYYDQGMACGGAYWVFKNGEAYTISPEKTNFICTYSKIGNNWVGQATISNAHIYFKSTLVGLNILVPPINPTNTTYTMHFPRCFFTVLSP